MKIQTFTVVVGGNKCNATCPYCVSKLTGKSTCSDKIEDINFRNFHKACQFAKMSGVSTVLLTGKGEPLLYPDHITKYLKVLQDYNFPFIELQTNGIEFEVLSGHLLKRWYDLGLTTISLSCVHYDSESFKEIFGRGVDLDKNVKMLHNFGFSVRVSCIMTKGYVDSVKSIIKFIDWCRSRKVEQFTVRPVTNITGIAGDKDKLRIYNWIEENEISEEELAHIQRYFDGSAKSTLLLELAHGAKVYDYDGQNISISNCLTESKNPDDIRQLIFFPDGKLRYSWTKPGAIII